MWGDSSLQTGRFLRREDGLRCEDIPAAKIMELYCSGTISSDRTCAYAAVIYGVCTGFSLQRHFSVLTYRSVTLIKHKMNKPKLKSET